MKCPVDDQTLVMSERQGIEIDYCPDCRGVWLDRGELDKILERAAPDEPRDQRRSDGDDDTRLSFRNPKKKKKREGFLSEIFEFGG